jgi:hypothetical protein
LPKHVRGRLGIVKLRTRVVGLRLPEEEFIRDVVLWDSDTGRAAIARGVVSKKRESLEEYATLAEALRKL